MIDWLENEKEIYRKNHQKSLKLWEKANGLFPAGLSHNVRDFNMTSLDLAPPYIKQVKGSKIFDIDGNTYIDYWMTHGVAILGHANETIMKAISEQIPYGIHYGTVNEHAVALAEKIIKATPSIQELKFCTTGTEATMYVSRLARAFTKKKLIAKVKGGWHGGNDTLFYFVKQTEKGMESNGLKSLDDAGIISFDYNDIEGFKKVINENKNDLAAVIMEPVLGAGGAIPPIKGFLETVREETEKRDILLVFDEIITGFRLDYHSGQGYFKIKPDLTTMGKIIGGGTPIGVVGGRKDIMELANPYKGGQVWIGGGTFSENVLSMIAGKATLDILEKGKNELYSKLNKNGANIREQVKEIIEKYKAPAMITGVGSMICIHWFKEPIPEIRTSSQIKIKTDKDKTNQFALLMFNRGIQVREGFGYLSMAHSEGDIQKTIKAINDSIKVIMHKK